MDYQGLRLVAHVFRACVLLFALLVAACGGGQSGAGGQGSSSSSSGNSSSQSSSSGSWVNNGESLYLFPSTNAVVAADYAYEDSGRAVNVTVAIQGRPDSAGYLAGRYSTSSIDHIQLTWDQSNQAILSIVFKAASMLTPGTHSDIVQLQLCDDASCVMPLDRSFIEIAVIYTVVPLTGEGSPSMQINPVAIDAVESVIGPSGINLNPVENVADIAFSNVLTPPSIITSTQGSIIQNANATVADGLQVTLQSPHSLGVGSYSGTVSLKVCLDGVVCEHQIQGSPFQIPVSYQVTDTYVQSGTYGFSWNLIPIAATDITWDSVSQRLYATTVSVDSRTGELAKINPLTKTVDWSFSLPAYPQRLAVSPDGQYAFVYTMDVAADFSQSNPQLRKFRLSDQMLMWTIDLPDQVSDFKISPSSGMYLVMSGSSTGLYLYSTNSGTLLDTDTAVSSFPHPVVWGGSESVLYSYSPDEDFLSKFSPTAVSLGYQSSVTVDLNTDQQAWNGLHYESGLILENHGAVYDVTSLAINTRLDIRTETSDTLFKPYSIASELDMAAGRSYFWYLNGSSVVLQSFDMNTHTALADFPTNSRSTFRLIRWGTDGLAYLHSGSTSEDSGIALVQGRFVVP